MPVTVLGQAEKEFGEVSYSMKNDNHNPNGLQGRIIKSTYEFIEPLIMAALLPVIIVYGVYQLLKKWQERNEKRKMEVQAEIERRQQIAQQAAKENEIEKRKERERLHAGIRAMPLNGFWREEVLDRGRKMCAVCGRTDNLEVHHIISLESLLRVFRITNTVQAAECKALWNPSNGVVLCKYHHDQTESSKFFHSNNNLV